ncbi:lipoprotein [Streptococcus pluranimalium]
MKKILLLLVSLVVLVGCSKSTLGENYEIQKNVDMTVENIKYENGYVYVKVAVDGSDLNGYPTFVTENFKVTDDDDNALKYMQVEYGKNSYDTVTGSTDDTFAPVVSVDGKGNFDLMFDADGDKSDHYKVTYEIDGKKLEWQN